METKKLENEISEQVKAIQDLLYQARCKSYELYSVIKKYAYVTELELIDEASEEHRDNFAMAQVAKGKSVSIPSEIDVIMTKLSQLFY